ncbi:MAG: EF-Tu/IF-2/RF-3 family GTPase [Candidatus Omnitrophota bacterium]
MAKRCRKCGVPMEGFLYKFVTSTIFGIRPSARDAALCNKCDARPGKEAVEGKEVGKIEHYYGHLSVGIIALTGALRVGDKIRIKGHTSDVKQNVGSMQIEHKDVTEAKDGDFVGVKVAQKVHPGDKVYKI